VQSSKNQRFQIEYGIAKNTERDTLHTGEVRQHVFVINDLKPASRYTYRITSKDYDSGARYFHTPKKEPATVRCAFYGQSRYPNITLETHLQMSDALLHQGFDFIVHTGNLLSGNPSHESEFFAEDWTRNFYLPLASIIDHTPYYLAAGPFDLDAQDDIDLLRRAFPTYDRHASYLIERGPLALAVISVPSHKEQSKAILNHLEKLLQQMSFAQWRCICLHTPIAGAGVSTWPEGAADKEKLWELLYRYRVDLVVSGACAQYQRVLPIQNPHDGNHQIHCINTGLGMEALRFGRSSLAFVQDRYLHYVDLKCTADQLEVSCRGLAAHVFDKLVITRNE
jgi:hypothetical protein